MRIDPTPASSRQRLRRRVLFGAAALLGAPLLYASQASALSFAQRSLSFRHTHTGESISVEYVPGASLPDEASRRIDWFLRDFRTGDAHAIDPQLLDQLYGLVVLTRTRAPFEVISGFRSTATNEALRRHGTGVASHSLHLEGRAIDIRLADTRLDDLRDAAIALQAGGVGFYPESQFVHIDTGRVRRW